MFITRSLLSYVVMCMLEGMCSDLGHKTHVGITGVIFWLIVVVVIMKIIDVMIKYYMDGSLHVASEVGLIK